MAVFDRGRIEQLAPPRVLYEQPATAFVARFVGSSYYLTRSAEESTWRALQRPFNVRAYGT